MSDVKLKQLMWYELQDMHTAIVAGSRWFIIWTVAAGPWDDDPERKLRMDDFKGILGSPQSYATVDEAKADATRIYEEFIRSHIA